MLLNSIRIDVRNVRTFVLFKIMGRPFERLAWYVIPRYRIPAHNFDKNEYLLKFI